MQNTNYFSSKNIGDTLISSCKAVLIHPRKYFEAMPLAKDYGNAIVLLSIYITIPAVVISIGTGIVTIFVILPVALIFGFLATWSWAWYLAWASRVFFRVPLATVDTFQICAYGFAPLIFAWVPVFGVMTFIWNLFLNWQGLVSHGKVGGGAALLIILASYIISAVLMVVMGFMLVYLAAQYGLSLPTVPPSFMAI